MKVIIVYVIKFSELVHEITVTVIKCNNILIQLEICIFKLNCLKINAIVFGYYNIRLLQQFYPFL